MKPGAALWALMLLGGCAVMDADDCAKADWRQLGERDALDGHPVERLDKRAKACREHRFTADRGAYQLGHSAGQRVYCSAARGEGDAASGRLPAPLCLAPLQPAYDGGFNRGLRAFCQARQAYEHGARGGTDPRTCPELTRLDFETGHRLGREVYELGQQINRLQSEAASQRRRASDTKHTPEERQQATRRANELEAEARRVRNQQRQAELAALNLPR